MQKHVNTLLHDSQYGIGQSRIKLKIHYVKI